MCVRCVHVCVKRVATDGWMALWWAIYFQAPWQRWKAGAHILRKTNRHPLKLAQTRFEIFAVVQMCFIIKPSSIRNGCCCKLRIKFRTQTPKEKTKAWENGGLSFCLIPAPSNIREVCPLAHTDTHIHIHTNLAFVPYMQEMHLEESMNHWVWQSTTPKVAFFSGLGLMKPPY